MKKSLIVFLVFVVIASCAFAQGGSERGARKQYIAVGTASAGGAYYPVGIAIASAITDNVANVEASAQVTGGAVENCSLIQNKEMDVAISMSATAFQAYNGTGTFTTPLKDLRVIVNGLSEGIFHVVTLKRTGITKMTDLIGRSVAMGPAGGGAIALASVVWKEYGFTIDDIKATYISYADGVSALKDGKIDAVIVQSAAPASAIQELCTTNGSDVVLVPVDEAIAQRIVTASPYYSYKILPKDVYNISADSLVVYQTNILICNKDMDETLAYEITKACVENYTVIAESQPTARNFSPKAAAAAAVIDFHPGALRYFKEAGLI